MLNKDIIKKIKNSKGEIKINMYDTCDGLWIEIEEFIENKISSDYNKRTVIFDEVDYEDIESMEKDAEKIQSEIKKKTKIYIEIDLIEC